MSELKTIAWATEGHLKAWAKAKGDAGDGFISDVRKRQYPDMNRYYSIALTPLSDAQAEIDRLKAECETLRNLLSQAVDSIEFWAACASERFQDKHGLAEEVARFRAAIAKERE